MKNKKLSFAGNTAIAVLAAMIILITVITGTSGCTRKSDGVPEPSPAVTDAPDPTATSAPTATPTPAPTATPTPSPTPTPIPRVQDVFDQTDDEGVYSKIGAFTDVAASDLYYVDGRLIFSNVPRAEYDDVYAVGMLGEDAVYASTGNVTTPDEDDGDDDWDGDWGDGEWGDPPVDQGGTLHLYSVDPVTWDTKQIDIEDWGFYTTAITPIGNGKFALSCYYKTEMLIYNNMLELQNTIELDTEGNFRFSQDGTRIWYVKDQKLICYDMQTGEETKPDFYENLNASYFSDDTESVISILAAYENKKGTYKYTNFYFNTDTGEYLGKTDYYCRYRYSPDLKRAVRIKYGDINTIEVYECSEGNIFPGEPVTDPETGEELPPTTEALCRLDLQSAGETGTVIIDWDRDLILTDIFYWGDGDCIYEYNCYSMVTGKRLSNDIVTGFGTGNLYYTVDTDAGLYYTNYCDENDEANLFAWDYAADNVRDYQGVFKKFTSIPERVEEKRRELEEKYGFYIYLGSEVFASDFAYDLTIFNNYDQVYEQMCVIDEVFSIYPEGFFEQFKYGGIKTLSIYLCGGFTKRNDGSNTISDAIALATVFGYERALALDLNWSSCLKRTIVHELSHWIDGRIESEGQLGGYADFEDDWLKMNPDDFSYKNSYVSGRTVWKYIYDEYGSNENTYFIDSYSQTYATEDRARLFEYLMFNEDSGYSDYLAVPNLQDKLQFFFGAIRKCFDTSKWPEKTTWEEELDRRIAERETTGSDENAENTENAEN